MQNEKILQEQIRKAPLMWAITREGFVLRVIHYSGKDELYLKLFGISDTPNVDVKSCQELLTEEFSAKVFVVLDELNKNDRFNA